MRGEFFPECGGSRRIVQLANVDDGHRFIFYDYKAHVRFKIHFSSLDWLMNWSPINRQMEAWLYGK